MKVTYNWLKDFVDITLKPQELADKLTMAGLEVKATDKFEDDYVFEIEITSNRPDWLSVIGIAREVAAVTGKKLKQVTGYRSQVTGHRAQVIGYERRRAKSACRQGRDEERIIVNIEDKKACSFYSARIIRNIKVGVSPEWMVKRLQAIGLRSINNIVDITNYVLFTTGQPLHAFDLDTLDNADSHRLPFDFVQGRQVTGCRPKIIVRRARNGEEIVTIDGIKRKLNPETLVIANEHNSLAIAGIMGGKDTEVNAFTQNILLESAYFSPLTIRKASRALGLSSDSSYRFERSVDKGRIVDSSNLTAALILENAGGEIGKLYKAGSEKNAKKTIAFSVSYANRLLGKDVPIAKIKSILRALEFKIASAKKDALKIEAPDFRQDIKAGIDLIEEICRIAGYDSIPLTLPAVKQSPVSPDSLLAVQEKIRALCAGLGLNEAITYSLLSEESLKKARFPSKGLSRLQNPLSAEQEILQPTLLTGLLDTVRLNCELGNKAQGFFEIGNCFSNGLESRMLGVIAEENNLLDFKSIAELLLVKLGVREYSFSYASNPFFQEGQSALLRIRGQAIGLMGKVKGEITRDCKVENMNICALEINLDKLKVHIDFRKTYKALPKYPSVIRDVSMLIDEGISYQKVLDAVAASGVENLEEVRYKDVYRSDAIGKGKKSLTVSLAFRCAEQTLTDLAVNAYLDTVIKKLTRELAASIR